MRHCLNPNHVASRTCRKTYGMSVYAEWEDGMNPRARDQSKRDPKFGNRVMLDGVFDTLITKGEMVSVGHKVIRTLPLSCLQKVRWMCADACIIFAHVNHSVTDCSHSNMKSTRSQKGVCWLKALVA